MQPIIYIAGQVTGLPITEVQQRFAAKQLELQAQGYQIVNPTQLVPPNTEWQPAMKLCIAALLNCTHIYFLTSWKHSKGAILERTIATQLGLNIIYE